MNITQATKFLLAVGMVEYNFTLKTIAQRAGLDEWQCGKAEDYQERGLLAFLHYLNIKDREPFVQAVIDIASERGYITHESSGL